MKLRLLSTLLFVMTTLLGFACRSSSEDVADSHSEVISEYNLFIADSFGVEIGDSVSMIGSINSISYHPNGSLLVFDRVSMCIKVLPENDTPYQILRAGEGPGELQGPQGLCALEDGRILISDMYKREIMTFDTLGNYLGKYYPSNGEPPSEILAVDSSSIVGVMLDYKTVNGETQLYYSIDRYDSSIEPSVNYYQLNFDVTGWNESLCAIDALDFYADRAGNVYIVNDFTEYHIEVYTPNGIFDHQIDLPIDRLLKSEEQVENEIREYQEFAVNDASHSGRGYEPPPYEQLISISGVDSEGNLWIKRHDLRTAHFFDIWSPDGNLVNTAYFSNPSSDLEIEFIIDKYGMAGALNNSEEYPRIYFLNQ